MEKVILFGEDEEMLVGIYFVLKSNEYVSVKKVSSFEDLENQIKGDPCSVLIIDFSRDLRDYEYVRLKRIIESDPSMSSLAIIDGDSDELAEELLSLGVTEYNLKPLTERRFLTSMKLMMALNRLKRKLSGRNFLCG